MPVFAAIRVNLSTGPTQFFLFTEEEMEKSSKNPEARYRADNRSWLRKNHEGPLDPMAFPPD
jgi:hypothetical protein